MNGPALQSLFAGILYALFGVFVFSKLKGRPNRWVYILWAFTSAFWYITIVAIFFPINVVTAERCAKFTYTSIVFIPILMLHFCLAFLEDHTPKRWIMAGYGLAAFFGVTIWIDHWFLDGVYVRPWGYYPKGSYLHVVFMISVFMQTSYFFFRTTQKLKDPNLSPTKREQVLAIRRGLLWYAASSVDFLLNYGVHGYPLGPLLSVIGLAHIGYAIFRHQLLDIQVIIRRTLVYSMASTVLTSFYVGILFVTVELLSPIFGHGWESIIIACVITAFCHPLIRRIQRPIDRMLGRSQLDHGTELMKFSTELGQDQSAERARTLLGHIIEEAFRPTGYVVYRRSPKGFELFVQSDVPFAPPVLPSDNPWAQRFEKNAEAQAVSGMVLSLEDFPDKSFSVRAAAPMLNQKHLHGFILLGEKRSEDQYTDQDLILLRIVVNQAAGAIERPYLIKEVGAGFAHEIKTPLANIAMPAELCVFDLQDLLTRDYKNVEECLPVIIQRLEYIVDQALFASNRVDAMQQLSEATHFARLTHREMRELVEHAVRSLRESAQQAAVTLEIEISDDFAIAADKNQIDILVTNLIKNAIEAVLTSENRQVIVRAYRRGGNLLLDVEDSGPGIQEKDQTRVFEPYVSTKTGNTRGMGLYIARRIVQAHQGTLAYERRGTWTLMRVTIPLATGSSVTMPA